MDCALNLRDLFDRGGLRLHAVLKLSKIGSTEIGSESLKMVVLI